MQELPYNMTEEEYKRFSIMCNEMNLTDILKRIFDYYIDKLKDEISQPLGYRDYLQKVGGISKLNSISMEIVELFLGKE